MVRDENYSAPFDVEEEAGAGTPPELAPNATDPSLDTELSHDDSLDDDLIAARDAWESVGSGRQSTDVSDPVATDPVVDESLETESLAIAFVGRWNLLVSSTNWEKGHIINQWRGTLIDSGAPPSAYSDEAWARCVGGVTASHVGRLRRVHDAFAATYESYRGLYWTHFLVALDWDDAPLWLEGAVQSGWSVAGMRQQRWQANGGDEATRPSEADLVVELDEDFDPAAADKFTQPGQGGGSAKKYEDGPNAIGSGPAVEGPDFGDEESLNRAGGNFDLPAPEDNGDERPDEATIPLVQPFAGLPELPSDMADAVELLKLAILRHKTAGWKEISADAVSQYLRAFSVLLESRGK